jgi:hypothetical protein
MRWPGSGTRAPPPSACVSTAAEAVRGGKWLGATGKPLTTVVAIGIGGSYLGPAFVSEALATDPEGMERVSLCTQPRLAGRQGPAPRRAPCSRAPAAL